MIAYLVAVACAIVATGVGGIVLGNSHSVLASPFVTSIVIVSIALVLAPFAFFGIAITETERLDRWWPYALAGSTVAIAMTASSGPYDQPLPLVLLVSGGSGAVAGCAYWFIAWHMFPPAEKSGASE